MQRCKLKSRNDEKRKKGKAKTRNIVSLPPLDPNQRYPITPHAVAYLRKSRSKIYEDINAGRLVVIRDGALVFIPGSEIIRLSTLPAEAA